MQLFNCQVKFLSPSQISWKFCLSQNVQSESRELIPPYDYYAVSSRIA